MLTAKDLFYIGARFGFSSALFLHVKKQNKNYPEETAIQIRLDAFRDSIISEIAFDLDAFSVTLQALEEDIKKLYFRDA